MVKSVNGSLRVEVTRTKGLKCPRCYKYTHSMNYDDLCNRCVHIMITEYSNHPKTTLIIQDLDSRGLKPEDNSYLDNEIYP
jgi:hypothetical protein